MQYLNWIISGFGVLLGLLYYSNSKRKDAEATVSNIKMRQDMNQHDAVIDSDEAKEADETAKQEDLDNQIKQIEDNKDVPDAKALEEFFNRKPNS